MRNAIVEEDLLNIIHTDLPWEKLFKKTVLITGAGGFIASYIAETILYLNELHADKKIRVICLVRNRDAALKRFSHYRHRRDIDYLVQDVCKPIVLAEKVDYIIHAASYATPAKYGIDPVGTLLPNMLGTYYLLEYARKKSIQGLLFISSSEIYGGSSSAVEKMNEDYVGSLDPALLRSCYAESKRIGETMCISWFHQYHVPTKIVRLFHTYGPGMKLGDGRVHSDFVGNIVQGKDIIIKSDGKARRSFCYISDSIAGIFTVLLEGKPGEVYNIGSDTIISVKELAKLLVALSTQKIRIIQNPAPMEKGYLASSVTKQHPDIRKIGTLGWKPRYALVEGFRRTFDSYFPG